MATAFLDGRRGVDKSSGPFSFLIGLGSLVASSFMTLGKDAGLEAKSQEWKSHKYSHYIQEDYDLNTARMVLSYDFDKIKAAIRADYPGISDTWAYKITVTAIAKRMMEEETEWEYQVPEQILDANIDIDKYATDEFKRNDVGR